MGWNSWTFSAFQRWQNQYDQEQNTTTKQQFTFLIPGEKNSHVGVGVVMRFSNVVYQLSLNIFILGALRQSIMNNQACMSFKIEKIKLLLTMLHPWAGLLQQMPHLGEDKVVKCPTNAWGGDARSWNWQSHKPYNDFGHMSLNWFDSF